MKRPRVIELYRSAPAALPSAATDGQILGAARASGESRRSLRFTVAAAGLAAAMALTILVRWNASGDATPEYTVTNFGMEEGQSHAWLTSFQPTLTSTGPGAQEGIP
jgi:hypothetical protein